MPPAPPLGGAGTGMPLGGRGDQGPGSGFASAGNLTQWEEDGVPQGGKREKQTSHNGRVRGPDHPSPSGTGTKQVSDPLGHTAVSLPSGPGPSGFQKCWARVAWRSGQALALGCLAHCSLWEELILRVPRPTCSGQPPSPNQFPCDLGPKKALRHRGAHPARTPSSLGSPRQQHCLSWH